MPGAGFGQALKARPAAVSVQDDRDVVRESHAPHPLAQPGGVDPIERGEHDGRQPPAQAPKTRPRACIPCPGLCTLDSHSEPSTTILGRLRSSGRLPHSRVPARPQRGERPGCRPGEIPRGSRACRPGDPSQKAPSCRSASHSGHTLARADRLEEARVAFEKMLTYGNHLGLYSEEIGPSGELLGNFPQAFTHLSLISAAFNLDRQLGLRS
jgi:hypothetical protein